MNKKMYEMVKNTLFKLIKENKVPNISYGIAGSYARGEEEKTSDLDIVVNSELSIDEIEIIKSSFDTEVDILLLPLLKKEDEELDNMLQNMDLPINKDSVYKTVLREVIWIEY